jgi:hypothetical protein
VSDYHDVEDLPKLTPSLLSNGLRMCPRKARHTYDDRKGTWDAFTHWRLRKPFVQAARVAQATMRFPTSTDFPVPVDRFEEETVLWTRAAEVYVDRCSDRTAVAVEVVDADEPMPLPKRGVRLGGGVDVVVVDNDGGAELRQLEFWGKPLCADPFENWTVALAVLRMVRWARGREVLLRHIDVIGDVEETASFDFSNDVPELAEHFNAQLEALRGHVADPVARPGVDCGTCAYVAGCPAHR